MSWRCPVAYDNSPIHHDVHHLAVTQKSEGLQLRSKLLSQIATGKNDELPEMALAENMLFPKSSGLEVHFLYFIWSNYIKLLCLGPPNWLWKNIAVQVLAASVRPFLPTHCDPQIPRAQGFGFWSIGISQAGRPTAFAGKFKPKKAKNPRISKKNVDIISGNPISYTPNLPPNCGKIPEW